MGPMAAPRHAAPEEDLELQAVTRAWRRYMAWVIVGLAVAVVGLMLFGYLSWWSLCHQVIGVCKRGEPGIFWGATASAAILGAIIGILCQVWVERRTSAIIAAGAAGVILAAGVIFWFVV